MDKMQPIGVLDSGVGGLSVLKCLQDVYKRQACRALGSVPSYGSSSGCFLGN